MKKGLMAVLGAVMVIGGTAYAQFSVKGLDPTTVSVAKGLPDDHIVVLEGYIQTKVKDDLYLFKDDTGEIRVEIKDHVWRGVEVTPKIKVRLTGEIDKVMFRKAKVEVEKVELSKR